MREFNKFKRSPPAVHRVRRAHAAPALVLLALCIIVLPGQALAQTAAGRLEFAIGKVDIESQQGQARPARRGSAVYAGESIVTGRGRAQVRFADNSRISLIQNTRFEVQEFEFEHEASNDQASARSRSFFSLVRGGVRALTGLIGKRNKANWQMRTPAATIGIRGTHFRASFIDNQLLVAVGVDPDGLGPQGVQISNAFGTLAAGPGQNVQVNVGAQPRYTDAQPVLTQGSTPGSTTTTGRSDLSSGDIRSGNSLAVDNSNANDSTGNLGPALSGLVGASSASFLSLVSNHVAVAVDNTTAPIAVASLRDLNAVEAIARIDASVRDVQSGSDWILFAFEAGDILTIDSEGSFTATLPSPHGTIQFAFGTQTTSIPSIGFLDFNTVLGTLPATTNSALDPTGGILQSGLSVSYDASMSQLLFSNMSVKHLGTVYNINGTANVVSNPLGFVFHNQMTATGGVGACSDSCGATLGGALIGNQIAPPTVGSGIPPGANIPTGMAVGGLIDESPEKVSFGGVLGVSPNIPAM
ncbi:MAG: FecR domain-containing protein [Gammaproteobacteria bacterium]|nr:FecR domain-containing protein [Gammaproteobacteria bacterium]